MLRQLNRSPTHENPARLPWGAGPREPSQETLRQEEEGRVRLAILGTLAYMDLTADFGSPKKLHLPIIDAGTL
jgi:hypothetical protein